MILVVGATGFLGSDICRALRQAGRAVRAVVRPSSDPLRVEALRALGAELVQADLKDPGSLRRACQGARTVISTATTTLRDPDVDSIPDVDEQGGLNLVAAARAAGAEQFVYVSFPEGADLVPPSPLSRAKRAVEAELRRGPLPFTLLWPGVFMEVWLSPVMGFDAVQGRVRVFGEGARPIGWVSRLDVARVAAAAVDHPEWRGEPLNVVAENLSPDEVVRTFEEVVGRPLHVERVPRAALEAQLAAARTPLEQSFAALMLRLALGSAQPPDARLTGPTWQFSRVRDLARQVLGVTPPAPA